MEQSTRSRNRARRPSGASDLFGTLGVGAPVILSDRDIAARLAKGDLVVDPLDDPAVQVQPASVDLRLGDEFLVFRHTAVPFIDPASDAKESYTESVRVNRDGVFVLHPGEFALGTTYE